MREDVIITLKEHVYSYKNDKWTQKIGGAFLKLLRETSEPGRIWIGNMSTEQISTLTTLLPLNTVADYTQAQLNNIMLDFSHILSMGALSIN